MTLEYLVGFIVGVVFMTLLKGVQTSKGVLKIDSSDPDTDVYRLVLNDLDDIPKRKKIVLRIEHGADLSHK